MGDRLENILRYAFLGLMPVPGANLRHVYDLLRLGDAVDKIRERMLSSVENENIRNFMQEDLGTYSKADLQPPQNKLSRGQLASGTYGEMLS